jgi:seryl-tRNA synthetase
MLDVRYIRENTERCKARLAMRGRSYDAEIDRILELDALRRSIIGKVEQMKAEQNKVSKSIPARKKRGEDVSDIMAQMKGISEEIKVLDGRLAETDAALREVLLTVPNVPADRVPEGTDDSCNQEVRKFSAPREFSFAPKAHWDIGKALDILDPETAGKVTGSRFHFYKGLGARLERAVINYFLDTHSANGYTEILPPFMANTASMTGTGQLPKFAEDMYHLENTDVYLIPTAEVPVTNMYREEIIPCEMLPVRYAAYSACFRAEAGAAGRDARGLIRQHQFNKVELVNFVAAETSFDELEHLTAEAERVLQGLQLPYRVVILCTGDLGFSSACTYDIEVWMPSYNRYVEISSCSNFLDYQARRASIRGRNADGKPQLVHTLNGSGVAVGRTVAAILENYQNEDGSVSIPEALRPYMGGLEAIR